MRKAGGGSNCTDKSYACISAISSTSQKCTSLNFLAIFRLPSPEPVGFPDGGGEIESTVSQSTLSNLN